MSFQKEEFLLQGKLLRKIFLSSLDEEWNFIKEVESIKIYTKKSENINSVRGTRIVNISAEEFSKYTRGLESVHDYDKNHACSHYIKQIDEDNDIYYIQYNLGIPLFAPRDFILFESREILKDGSYIVSTTSLPNDYEDEKAKKLSEENGCIRAEVKVAGWKVTPIDKSSCQVDFIIQVNPKGWIPVFIINLVSTDEPLTILKIRNLYDKLKEEGSSFEEKYLGKSKE